MIGCELIGTENQLNLCFLWKQKYCSFDPRYPREREYKMGVLGRLLVFGALLWRALRSMQDLGKSKDLQFHYRFYKPREDLITRNPRVRDHKK